MPPVMESSSDREEDDTADDEEEEEEEEEEDIKVKSEIEKDAGRKGRNDCILHRSPSPSSACHSLEWDSNGDDFFANDCRPAPQKSS